MAPDSNTDSRPITDVQQLLDYLRRGEKSPDNRGIGTEHEKFVIRRSTGEMLSFEEPGGFGDIYQQLVDRFDWKPTPLDDGNLVAVVRDNASVTLEPGGQFELSGRICDTIFEIADEFDDHIREVRAIADDDLQFAIWGMNPCKAPEDVPWMPKSRYRIMRDYLPTRGKLAHWMMKTTCTVQANFDYCSEDDLAELVHTAVLASPVVGALFANSPIQNGQFTDYQSRRNYVWWHHTDPDRTGIPPFMYSMDWGYREVIDHIVDVPMFFIERDGELIDMAGHSFRDFLADGYRDWQPTIDDFELHMSTLFPDVRIKQFVEVRTADGGPREAVLALPALWKGLLYDDSARRLVRDLFDPVDEDQHRQLIQTCYRDGIHGDSHYGPVAELAQQLVDISTDGLQQISDDAGHPPETEFLAPLQKRLDTGRSWADELIDDYRKFDGDLVALADKWAV